MALKWVERIGFGAALTEWGLHECSGRLRAQLGTQPVSPTDALAIILQTRAPLVAQLLAAEPAETWRIELDPADIPNLHALEHRLEAHAQAMVAAVGTGGDHVRALVGAGAIDGPILGTAKKGDHRIFFIDGLHRVWAWAELVRQGRGGNIQASLVITERTSWWAEERARLLTLASPP